MTRRPARAVMLSVAGLVVLGVAGCSGSDSAGRQAGPPTGGGSSANVRVDTPKLRQLRAEAGIEPCPQAGSGPKTSPGSPSAGPPSPGSPSAGSPSAGSPSAGSSPGDRLPATTLPCLGGGDDVRLSRLRGRPTVINLWASWCGPCRKELPYLQRLHRTSDRVRVVGIDFEDRSPAQALELAADTGVTYPLLADPQGRTRSDLQVIGLPQTVFVDRSGRIVATERREVSSYRQLVDLVRKHLKVAP